MQSMFMLEKKCGIMGVTVFKLNNHHCWCQSMLLDSGRNVHGLGNMYKFYSHYILSHSSSPSHIMLFLPAC